MTLDQLLKLLSAAKFPLAVAAFGMVLNVGGSNLFLKNAGASTALLATGSAVAVASRKNSHLSEVADLQRRHEAEKATLTNRVELAESRATTAEQKLNSANTIKAKLEGTAQELRAQLTTLKASHRKETERLNGEVLEISNTLNTATAALGTCKNDSSVLAGQIERLEIERMQLIYELYETAVTEADIAQNIADLEKQFQSDSAYQVGQKKKAKSELTKARATYHTEITEAQERIEELETALAEKTALAQQAIADLDNDARGNFAQFGGKAAAQDEVIKSLQLQLDEARKTIKAHTLKRFDDVGTDNIIGNRLIDSLAKHGNIYGAHYHERTGHNGRLQVWLKLVDATLSRAQNALDEVEAELSLWAKPTVKVDRGMHLFTLATEQEHKVLEAPNVPLSRLEKTLDTAIHVRIVGGSGSGKTVLLNNLMHYMAATMEGANTTLLDPKAVDDWGSFIPKYWGEECVTGIVDLANGLKHRVADTVQARKAGKPAPKYSPELFVLDEAQHNYLLAQNADDSSTETGKNAPKYAKKAKGALAGLLSLGRAYNAIGLFVTQLPQVSKVGLNEGSFDPCVNIFLGVQIDNAIDKFLPASGYSDKRCKALSKELDTRRKLGQKWLMLVCDLPKTEAYLMECPAPGYYHNRFSQDLSGFTETVKAVKTVQSPDMQCVESLEDSTPLEGSTAVLQHSTAALQADSTPSAHCPECGNLSHKLHGKKALKSGKFRFVCENSECKKGAKKGSFSAFPLANQKA